METPTHHSHTLARSQSASKKLIVVVVIIALVEDARHDLVESLPKLCLLLLVAFEEARERSVEPGADRVLLRFIITVSVSVSGALATVIISVVLIFFSKKGRVCVERRLDRQATGERGAGG